MKRDENNTLDEEGIRNVIWGAALLAGGGGGSKAWGETMLEDYIETHPGEIKLKLISPSDMDENAFALVTAGIGAPSKLKSDFSPSANNAFNGFKQRYPERDIKYSLAAELGGFNTFVAMLIALEQDIPLVDSDCCARAVPALETTLFSVNENAICPLVMADSHNNQAVIDLADPKDAAQAEAIARDISEKFDGMAGISGWLIQKKAVIDTLPAGSISLCEKVGAVLRDNTIHPLDKWPKIAEFIPCRHLCSARTANGSSQPTKGFDVGYVAFENATNSGMNYYTTYFQNETMVITEGSKTVMTIPDIIGIFDVETGEPVSNADFFDESGHIKNVNTTVSIGLIEVDKKWHAQGLEKLNAIWLPHIKAAYKDYAGGVVPYSSSEK